MYLRARKLYDVYVYDPGSDVALWGFFDYIREDIEEGVRFTCRRYRDRVFCEGVGGARQYSTDVIPCVSKTGSVYYVNYVPHGPLKGVVCPGFDNGYRWILRVDIDIEVPRCRYGMCVYNCFGGGCTLRYFGDDVWEVFDRGIQDLVWRRVKGINNFVVFV